MYFKKFIIAPYLAIQGLHNKKYKKFAFFYLITKLAWETYVIAQKVPKRVLDEI